jgi:protein phosphatase
LAVIAGACSVQGVRRDTNEDSQYISPEMSLFIVADGIGGHAAGEVASRFAVDVLSHELAHIPVEADAKEIECRVHRALDRAHCLILDTAAHNLECRGAGTTVVLAVLLNHRLYVAGVGDSRAYLVRGGVIKRLTIDDTWPDTLVQLGQLSVDEARRHHMRNVLFVALGMEQFKANEEPIQVIDVFHADRYLLASDGLTDAVDEQRLLEIVKHNDNPQQAAELLTQEAIANGAGDDVTCVVFYVQSDLSYEPAAAPRLTAWQRLKSLFTPTRLWPRRQ